MVTIETQGICCALIKSKGCRCKAATKGGTDLCGTHLKATNIIRYTDNIPITLKTKTKTNSKENLVQIPAIVIPILYRSRIRYNTVKIKDLHKTLEHYNISTIGNKKILFERLLTHFDSLLPYINYNNSILKIQNYLRKKINTNLNSLQQYFNFSINDCINDTDVLTLDKLKELDPGYLFTYKDSDNFIYGFDVRTISKLLENEPVNPYTGKLFDTDTINKISKLLHYLSIKGIKLTHEKETSEEVNDSKYKIKRRVIKVFQEMDSLDQYTNPSWFLDLNLNKLYRFYKEAEDIWNYRLNLTKETKSKIVPPDGKVFKIEPKNVFKNHNTISKLQELCLEVIEKLIYSANDRSDRVNGCIYVLLALVIVNKEAALAMPSYYTMVTGDVINANYIDIPI